MLTSPPPPDPGAITQNPANVGVDNSYVNPDKLIQDVQELQNAALRLRTDEEREWLKAWAYFKGRHWVSWRDDRLIEIEQTDIPKMVINLTMNAVMTRLGHLTKNRPAWTCVPANSDEASRQATRLGMKVLEAYYRKLKMGKKLRRAILWMLVPGISYLRHGWDPMAGGEWERKQSTGEALNGFMGEPFIDVAKPHEVLVEPGADDLDGTQRLIYRAFLPIGKVLTMYPSLRGKINPIDPSTQQGRALLTQLYGYESTVPVTVLNRVELQVIHYRRGAARPDSPGSDTFDQGLYAVIVNGKEVAEAGPVAEGMPEIPFVKFGEIDTDGYYSTSTARQLIDLNKIVDIEFSQQEYNRKALRPKTLIPYQANVPRESWDKTDDEVVEYFHPYTPQAYTPPGLPAHHIEMRNALIGMVKELAGNTDILSGKAPGETRSGRMVSYLQEYAGTVLGTVSQNIEDGYQESGEMLMGMLRARVREDRLLSIVGSNRRTEVVRFKGEQLTGIAGVVVQPGSALPVSRAERTDRIEKYMGNGWLDPQRGMRLLNLAEPDNEEWDPDIQDRDNGDDAVAKLQALTVDGVKLAIVQGQQKAAMRAMASPMAPPFSERDTLRALGIEAFDFDNHAVIIEQVNKGHRKTNAYRSAPPGMRALADAFCDWHQLLAANLDPDNPEGSALGQPGAAPPGGPGAHPGPPGPPGAPPPPGAGPQFGGPGGPTGQSSAPRGTEGAEGLPAVRPTAPPHPA